MAKYPWFRFYSEAIRDLKIARIARETHTPRATVLGVWVLMLSLASESPERGKLKLANGAWLTESEIIAETGLDPITFGKLSSAFQGLDMLQATPAGYEIANWQSRQNRKYSQNPDAIRKREYRARIKAEKAALAHTTDQRTINRPLFEIPPALENDEFIDLWIRWIRHLRSLEIVVTPEAGDTELERLEEMGLERAIAAIRHSLGGNWRRIYEPTERQILGQAADLLWAKTASEMSRKGAAGAPDLDEDARRAIELAGGWTALCRMRLDKAEKVFRSSLAEVSP